MVVAIVAIILGLLSRVPGLREATTDRDRARFEQLLAAAEQAQSPQTTIRLLTQRLAQPISPGWEVLLRQRLYQQLITAGKKSPPAQAEILFRQARDMASAHGLSSELAELHLAHLQLLSDAHTQTRAAAADTVGMLIAWGDSLTGSLQGRRDRYLLAAALADKHGLDRSVAAGRLAQVDRLCEAHAPRRCPTGTTVRLVHVWDVAWPPLLILDCGIGTQQETPLPPLQAKDFAVTGGSQPLTLLSATRVAAAAAPLSVAVLLDCSKSVTYRLAAAKAGATRTTWQLASHQLLGRAYCLFL